MKKIVEDVLIALILVLGLFYHLKVIEAVESNRKSLNFQRNAKSISQMQHNELTGKNNYWSVFIKPVQVLKREAN